MPLAGEIVRASDSGGWDDFALSFDTGVTALGSAVVDSRYIQIGDTVIGYATITFAANSTFSGTFLVDLPVDAVAAANLTIGTIFAQDGSGGVGTRRAGSLVLATASTAYFLLADVANNVITSTVPWTWATTDVLTFSFEYEAAA